MHRRQERTRGQRTRAIALLVLVTLALLVGLLPVRPVATAVDSSASPIAIEVSAA